MDMNASNRHEKFQRSSVPLTYSHEHLSLLRLSVVFTSIRSHYISVHSIKIYPQLAKSWQARFRTYNWRCNYDSFTN